MVETTDPETLRRRAYMREYMRRYRVTPEGKAILGAAQRLYDARRRDRSPVAISTGDTSPSMKGSHR